MPLPWEEDWSGTSVKTAPAVTTEKKPWEEDWSVPVSPALPYSNKTSAAILRGMRPDLFPPEAAPGIPLMPAPQVVAGQVTPFPAPTPLVGGASIVPVIQQPKAITRFPAEVGSGFGRGAYVRPAPVPVPLAEQRPATPALGLYPMPDVSKATPEIPSLSTATPESQRTDISYYTKELMSAIDSVKSNLQAEANKKGFVRQAVEQAVSTALAVPKAGGALGVSLAARRKHLENLQRLQNTAPGSVSPSDIQTMALDVANDIAASGALAVYPSEDLKGELAGLVGMPLGLMGPSVAAKGIAGIGKTALEKKAITPSPLLPTLAGFPEAGAAVASAKAAGGLPAEQIGRSMAEGAIQAVPFALSTLPPRDLEESDADYAKKVAEHLGNTVKTFAEFSGGMKALGAAGKRAWETLQRETPAGSYHPATRPPTPMPPRAVERVPPEEEFYQPEGAGYGDMTEGGIPAPIPPVPLKPSPHPGRATKARPGVPEGGWTANDPRLVPMLAEAVGTERVVRMSGKERLALANDPERLARESAAYLAGKPITLAPARTEADLAAKALEGKPIGEVVTVPGENPSQAVKIGAPQTPPSRNAVQVEILKASGIPKDKLPDYVNDTVADGATLGKHAEAVRTGDETIEDAARAITADYALKKASPAVQPISATAAPQEAKPQQAAPSTGRAVEPPQGAAVEAIPKSSAAATSSAQDEIWRLANQYDAIPESQRTPVQKRYLAALKQVLRPENRGGDPNDRATISNALSDESRAVIPDDLTDLDAHDAFWETIKTSPAPTATPKQPATFKVTPEPTVPPKSAGAGEPVAKAGEGMTPEAEYDAARATASAASREFAKAQKAYRAKEIDDAAFLEAKAKEKAALEVFDKAETKFIDAKNAAVKSPSKPPPSPQPPAATAKGETGLAKDVAKLKAKGRKGKGLAREDTSMMRAPSALSGGSKEEAGNIVDRAMEIKAESQKEGMAKLAKMSESDLSAMSESDLDSLLADVNRGPGNYRWDKASYVAELMKYKQGKAPAPIKVESTPEGKTVSVPSKDKPGITPKEQKKYLLAELDKAIEGAPETDQPFPESDIQKKAKSQGKMVQETLGTKPGIPEGYFGNKEVEAKHKADVAEWESRIEKELEPLMQEYGIPKEEPRRAFKDIDGNEQITNEGGTLSFEERTNRLSNEIRNAQLRNVTEEWPTVTIEVPGDGEFTIRNHKDELKQFKITAAKKFPTTSAKAILPTLKSTEPTGIPKAATTRPDKLEDLKKIVDPFRSEDTTRGVIQESHVDAATHSLIATDGRRLLVVKNVKGPTTKHFSIDKDTGKKSEAEFPNWKQVMPDYGKGTDFTPYQITDTERMIRQLRQAQQVSDGRKTTVDIFVAEDGSLIVAHKNADIGEYQSGDLKGAKKLVTVNPSFLEEGIVAMRKLGNEEVTLRVQDEVTPIVLSGKDATYILMPVKGEADVYSKRQPTPPPAAPSEKGATAQYSRQSGKEIGGLKDERNTAAGSHGTDLSERGQLPRPTRERWQGKMEALGRKNPRLVQPVESLLAQSKWFKESSRRAAASGYDLIPVSNVAGDPGIGGATFPHDDVILITPSPKRAVVFEHEMLHGRYAKGHPTAKALVDGVERTGITLRDYVDAQLADPERRKFLEDQTALSGKSAADQSAEEIAAMYASGDRRVEGAFKDRKTAESLREAFRASEPVPSEKQAADEKGQEAGPNAPGEPPRVGVGAAAASKAQADSAEFIGDVAGTSESYVDEIRQRMGMEPIPRGERGQKDEVTLQKALDEVKANPNAGRDLVQQQQTEPKPILDFERVILLRESVIAEKAVNAARSMDAELPKGATDMDRKKSAIRMETAEQYLDDIHRALGKSGSEAGATLRAIRFMMNERYQLEPMLSRRRIANEGKLTRDQIAETKALQAKIAELQKALDEANAAGNADAAAAASEDLQKATDKWGDAIKRDKTNGDHWAKAVEDYLQDRKTMLPESVKDRIIAAIREAAKIPDDAARDKAVMSVIDDLNTYVPMKKGDWFDAYLYTNLLSSPRTSERNIFGNLQNALWTRPLSLLVRGDIKGLMTYEKKAIASVGEAWRDAVGAFRSGEEGKYSEGLQEIPTTAPETQKRVMLMDQAKRITGPTSKSGKVAWKALSATGRFVNAQDVFFGRVILNAEQARLISKKVSPVSAEARARNLANEYLYRDPLKPISDQSANGVSRALEYFGWVLDKYRKQSSPALLRYPAKVVVPFLRTIVKIADFNVKMSAAGFHGVGLNRIAKAHYGKTFAEMKLELKEQTSRPADKQNKVTISELETAILEVTETHQERISRAAIGTAFTIAGIVDAMAGATTWGAPKTDKERKLFYDAGYTSHSIRRFGYSIPMIYLGPGMLSYAIGPAIRDILVDNPDAVNDGIVNKAFYIGMAIPQLVMSQLPIQGVAELFNALNGTEEYRVKRFAGGVMKEFIPLSGALNWLAQLTDPSIRKRTTIGDTIKAGIPGLSKSVKAIKDSQGLDATRNVMDIMTPWTIAEIDPVAEGQYKTAMRAKMERSRLAAEQEPVLEGIRKPQTAQEPKKPR